MLSNQPGLGRHEGCAQRRRQEYRGESHGVLLSKLVSYEVGPEGKASFDNRGVGLVLAYPKQHSL